MEPLSVGSLQSLATIDSLSSADGAPSAWAAATHRYLCGLKFGPTMRSVDFMQAASLPEKIGLTHRAIFLHRMQIAPARGR